MTETLISRLQRYGDDLDAAATTGPIDGEAYLPSASAPDPSRRGARLAVAAATVVLAGGAGLAVAAIGEDPADIPVATDATDTTEAADTTETTEPADALAPLFDDGFPTDEFTDTVTMADGFTLDVGMIDGTMSIGGPAYGDPSLPAGASTMFDAASYAERPDRIVERPPVPTPWDSPWGRPLMSGYGLAGANVARVEFTDADGTTYGVDTVELPSLPGTRAWGLNIPIEAHIVAHVYLSADGTVLDDRSACAISNRYFGEAAMQAGATGDGDRPGSYVPAPPDEATAAAIEECDAIRGVRSS